MAATKTLIASKKKRPVLKKLNSKQKIAALLNELRPALQAIVCFDQNSKLRWPKIKVALAE